MTTTVLRVLDAADKEVGLLSALRARLSARNDGVVFVVEPESFRSLPMSPFSYWARPSAVKAFGTHPQLEGTQRQARVGLQTSDDFRFLRLAWEPQATIGTARWTGFAKGGAYSPFYGDLHLLVGWADDGRELKASGRGRNEAVIRNPRYFMRPGLTWTRRTKRPLSLRCMPAQAVFGDKGPCIFLEPPSASDSLATLAITLSAPFLYLVDLVMAAADGRRGGAARSYEVGVVQRTPCPHPEPGTSARLAALAHHAWSAKRSLDTANETSHAFVLPALLQTCAPSVEDRAQEWSARQESVDEQLVSIQSEIDDISFDLYEITDEDREAILTGFGSEAATAPAAEDEPGDDEELAADSDPRTLAQDLVSWAVGVAFGRFDVRLATGEQAWPDEPDPFDPLPSCSAGMLTGDDGLPAPEPPLAYPIAVPEDGVLVDDPSSELDIVRRVRAVFDVVFGQHADQWWDEVGRLLDPRSGEIRTWIRKGFFESHIKTYSKSRRKAPIYWQLGTATNSYAVWIYAHKATADTLYRVAGDIVRPRRDAAEAAHRNLIQDAGPSPTKKQLGEIDSAKTLYDELRTMDTELTRIAPLWQPDLDDGVVIAMSPLWRLIPQHAPWRRELKGMWTKLANGDYDWAHLSMHLWPERVVPQCTTDRSFAIAHSLEDDFWVETNGSWEKRIPALRTTDDIISERQSAAVKAALEDFEHAPEPAVRNRGRRAAA